MYGFPGLRPTRIFANPSAAKPPAMLGAATKLQKRKRPRPPDSSRRARLKPRGGPRLPSLRLGILRVSSTPPDSDTAHARASR